MNKAIIMFVMLLGSFTYAQTFDFDCIDYIKLRADRVADVEALGNTEVFALLAIQEDPAETTTIIFNKQLTAYVDVVYSHVERWEQSDYDAYLTDLEDKVNAQIFRNERIVILENAFIQYSTATVSISLSPGIDSDAILFDGGLYSLVLPLDNLIENIPYLESFILQFSVYVNNVQNELNNIKAAALKANEDAFDAALNSNTATSTLGREIELEDLSRDGIEAIVTILSQGFVIEFHDANGLITILDQDGDPVEQKFETWANLDVVTGYGQYTYNNAVTKIRDLVRDLIIN